MAQKKKNKRRRRQFQQKVILSVLLVIIIGLIGVLGYQMQKNEKNQTDGNASASSSDRHPLLLGTVQSRYRIPARRRRLHRRLSRYSRFRQMV